MTKLFNFDNKFKVRVRYDYFHDGKAWYRVEWCNYRLIKRWKCILDWDETFGGSEKGFSSYKNAMSFAKKLKSYSDIESYYAELLEKKKAYCRRQCALYEKKTKNPKITML